MVETPAIYPQACVFCGSGKGPLVDSVREVAGGGRGYICALCVSRCAKALGLVKGERMAELLKAGELLDGARKEIDARDQRIEQQLTTSAADRRKIEALSELLEQERADAQTRRRLAEMIHENSRQLVQPNGAS